MDELHIVNVKKQYPHKKGKHELPLHRQRSVVITVKASVQAIKDRRSMKEIMQAYAQWEKTLSAAAVKEVRAWSRLGKKICEEEEEERADNQS